MLVKLDIGCGPNKKEGFTGVDQYKFDGVDIVGDVASLEFWNTLEAGSVEEVNASHFVEHLDAMQRVTFYNGLWRVMKLDAKATIVTPYWCSNRAYGDPTHQWPPISEMSFFYLSRKWRAENAPHTDAQWLPNGYECNFEAGWGYNPHPILATKNREYQEMALTFHKEAAQDMITTLTKRE